MVFYVHVVTFKFISIVIPTNFQLIQIPNIETKTGIVLLPNNFEMKYCHGWLRIRLKKNDKNCQPCEP